MEAARSIREDFLHQFAFHEVDTYSSLHKQHTMMQLVLAYYDMASAALQKGADIEDIIKLPVRERIGRAKYVKEENVDAEYEQTISQLDFEISEALKKGED